jgi:hypothetical protein
MMKFGWMLSVLVALLLIGATLSHAQTQTFTGEIMDADCAGGGSHAGMLKEHGMAGKENDPAAKKMCTLDCVKAGSTFVLYDSATKTAYKLDDQKKPVAFAGANVKITGTLNKATQTIHVTSIKGA